MSRFRNLEACFREAASTRPVPVRLARLMALTDAAIALAGALSLSFNLNSIQIRVYMDYSLIYLIDG